MAYRGKRTRYRAPGIGDRRKASFIFLECIDHSSGLSSKSIQNSHRRFEPWPGDRRHPYRKPFRHLKISPVPKERVPEIRYRRNSHLQKTHSPQGLSLAHRNYSTDADYGSRSSRTKGLLCQLKERGLDYIPASVTYSVTILRRH